MSVRITFPCCPAVRSIRPLCRAFSATFAARSLSGARLSGSLTISMAAIGPRPRTSPIRSGCFSCISRIAEVTRAPGMLDGEHPARPSEAGLDLVRYQQYAVLVAQLPQAPQVEVRERDE